MARPAPPHSLKTSGAEAVERLLAQIASPGAPFVRRPLPVRLIEGASVRMLRADEAFRVMRVNLRAAPPLMMGAAPPTVQDDAQ